MTTSVTSDIVYSLYFDVGFVQLTCLVCMYFICDRCNIVLSCLPQPQQQELRRSASMVSEVGFLCDAAGKLAYARDDVEVVDSHFHLDKLLQRARRATFGEVQEALLSLVMGNLYMCLGKRLAFLDCVYFAFCLTEFREWVMSSQLGMKVYLFCVNGFVSSL